MSEWRGGNEIGAIYILGKEDLSRVGDCWMAGRLKIGDLALCIKHSGDCFFDYILLKCGVNFLTGIPGSEFGSYTFGGKPMEWHPSMREFHLLCAGETLSVPIMQEHPVRIEVDKRRPK